MKQSFNAARGLILVRVLVTGPADIVPTRNAILSLALDTGATATLINQSRLMQLGYDPAAQSERLQITTGSGIEFVPRLQVSKIILLGQSRTDFPVLCHTLPPSARVDGLIGLDFLRGHELTLDFRSGQIDFN